MTVLPTQEAVDEKHWLTYVKSPFYYALSQPRHVLFATADFLKPDIFRRRTSTPAEASNRSSTAYLDGLRGWAAMMVVGVHLAVYTHYDIERCYGAELSPGVFVDTPAQLPFLRLIFSGGHFSVAVFFCISGYVLTQRLISLMHQDRKEDFMRSVHSSILRRPLRVYMPVAWSTGIFATIWHVTGLATPWPEHQSNIIYEWAHWFIQTTNFMFVFKDGFLFTIYNIHTWTIPVELRGSMFVFVWLFAWHHIPHRPRILLTAAETFHLVFLSNGAMYGLFFAGMLTAELHLIYADSCPITVSLPWDRPLRWLWRRPVVYKIFLHVLLVLGLYLASQPTSHDQTAEKTLGHCYGWSTLSKVIPMVYDKTNFRFFWFFFAAWFTVLTSREISWFRTFLESTISQYLGRVSFALYLVHGPMIGLFSERLFWLAGVWVDITQRGQDNIEKFGHLHNKWLDAPWFPFPSTGPYGLEPNFLFCCVVSLVVILYVAELGTKIFDKPSVTFSRWFYEKTKTLK